MAKVLYLAHRIPFPPNKGDKIRSFHEIKFLSRSHEIHLLAFYDDPADAGYGRDLERYCRSVTLIPLDPRRQMAKALIAMLTGKPWTLGFYESPAMRSAVSRVFRDAQIEAAFAYSSSMGPYIAYLPCRRVLDFVDSDAVKWRQYSEAMSFPKSWLYWYESHRLSAFEVEMIRAFDASVFVSPRETSWIEKDERMAAKLHFVPNGIDLDYFQPRAAQPAKPIIIFTGAMDYLPNVDAVQFFARSVFPLIRSKVPAAQFLIVGSKPSRAVRRLAGIPGVRVTGAVPDVRPYLAQARVAVAPLRISQGIQNKVLEALAMGLRAVITPQVAGGITAIEQLPVHVAAAPDDMAGCVLRNLDLRCLSDLQLAATRSSLQQYFSWDQNVGRLELLLGIGGGTVHSGIRS